MANSKAKEAKADYLAGRSYKDIAKRYDVSEATVRSWKSRYKWDETDSKEQLKRKRNTATQNVATQQKTPQHVATGTQREEMQEVLEGAELTEKQKLFCAYYLQRFNATWAYQKAYGTNYETSMAAGSMLLGKFKIREAIKELKAKQRQELFIDANDILLEYIKQATASLDNILEYDTATIQAQDHDGAVLDKDGNPVEYQRVNLKLKPSDQIDWSVVQDIHLGRDGLVVKLYDKQKAMKELLDRLPEPEDSSIDMDNFLKAIMQQKKVKSDDSATS